MPEGWAAYYDLAQFPSWGQYVLMCRSLQKAQQVDNPEETVMLQATISEASIISLGLLCVCRMFPEFTPLANSLSEKIADVGEAQGFLKPKDDTLDKE